MLPLPLSNIIIFILYNQIPKRHRCHRCGSANYIKYGFFRRRRIHSFFPNFIEVQRFKCREPGCGRTFSVKPVPILPYCRFSLWHLLQIEEWLQTGVSAYRAAKRFALNLPVVLRLKVYLEKVKHFVAEEWKISGHFTRTSLLLQWVGLIKESSWFDLTWKFFHKIYPLRVT